MITEIKALRKFTLFAQSCPPVEFIPWLYVAVQPGKGRYFQYLTRCSFGDGDCSSVPELRNAHLLARHFDPAMAFLHILSLEFDCFRGGDADWYPKAKLQIVSACPDVFPYLQTEIEAKAHKVKWLTEFSRLEGVLVSQAEEKEIQTAKKEDSFKFY